MSTTIAAKETVQERDLSRIMFLFYYVIAGALLITAFGAGHFRTALAALLWAVACLAVGTCTGFLFGIPKTLQSDKLDPRTSNQSAGKNASEERSYRSIVNTNLLEISDWLTKIIVGLGLINLKAIPGLVLKIARVLSSSMADNSCQCATSCGSDYTAFAVGVVVSFVSLGFLFGYLFTRLYLAAAFVRADLDGLASTRETAEAAGGAVESLRESVAVLNEKVKQIDPQPSPAMAPAPAPRGNDLPVESMESAKPDSTQSATVEPASSVAPSLAPAYEIQLLALAKAYNEFSANTREERVTVRNDLTSKMAVIINGNSGARAWATNVARNEGNVGLIAGLATAMNAVPQPGDMEKLFQFAGRVTYKHPRYKVATALGRLFESGVATAADVDRARRILHSYFNEDSDASLQRRVTYTLAQISKAIGKTVELEE